MNTWDERMRRHGRRQMKSRLEHLATLFRVRGASRRPLRCAVYKVATGLEVRLEYEDRDDLLQSRLFRLRDDNAIATLADDWLRALIANGFEDLPV